MSGIFGFWNLDGRPADPSVLLDMSNTLAHRGPDGWDTWFRGPVALGHRMFRTTPESAHEQQPLILRDGACVLTTDLFLDNRDELIRSLQLRGRPAWMISDAELLGHAHESHGASLPEHLLGAFAVAIWDERRRELSCVRDHFGVKPLYYVHIPGRLFAFASEVKALLAIHEVPQEVDELEIARHLMLPVTEDMGATYFRNIRRVLPGHVLRLTSTGVESRCYWSLDATRSLELSSDEAYAEAVRESFVEAVRCRLRTQAPIASMLSGGIDSSSITCVAAGLLKEAGSAPLLSLSAIYEDVPESDERFFIQKVLQAHDLGPTFFAADRVSPVADIHQLNWHGDGANKAGNLYLNWNLYRAAAAAGARVVLDGYDGDSTISHGHGFLPELALSGRWLTLALETRASAEKNGEPWRGVFGAWVRKYGVKPLIRKIPFRGTMEVHFGARRPKDQPWAAGLARDYRLGISSQIVPRSPQPRTEREHHRGLMQRPILLQALSWVEATGAAAGVEVRLPFFDVRLVELCLSLPPEQKLRRGWTRLVMRHAMGGILPVEIQWRPGKTSVQPGFDYALRSHAFEEMERVVQGADQILSRYVEPTYLSDLFRRFMAGTATPADDLRFWRFFSLALWLTGSRRAFPADGPAPCGGMDAPLSDPSTGGNTRKEVWHARTVGTEALPPTGSPAVGNGTGAHQAGQPAERRYSRW